MDVREVCEALERGFDKEHQKKASDAMECMTAHRWYWRWAQNLEANCKEALSALTSIDPDAIRAEARTEYRVELDAYIRTLRNFRDNWDCDEDAHAHGTTCRACEAADVLSHFARGAILADEPKERDGAITWSSVEVGMLAAMMTGNLEKDTATLAMYLLDEPKEREAKHDNEDSFHITQAQAAEWHTQLVEEEEENKRLQAQRDELLAAAKEMSEAVALLPATDGRILGLLPILCNLRAAIASAEKPPCA